MMNPTNVQDASAKVLYLFRDICKNLKLDHTIEVDPANEATEEYAFLLVNGGGQCVEIELKEVEDETIFGNIKGERVHYTVQHEVFIHGTRYYPDGSGEPDTSDIENDCVCTSPYETVAQLLKLNFACEVDNYLEAQAIYESEKEADEGWEEYCKDLERDSAMENR